MFSYGGHFPACSRGQQYRFLHYRGAHATRVAAGALAVIGSRAVHYVWAWVVSERDICCQAALHPCGTASGDAGFSRWKGVHFTLSLAVDE